LLTLKDDLYQLIKLSDYNKLNVRLLYSRTIRGAAMITLAILTVVTIVNSNFVPQASANCAFGGECEADHHTATGDSNNPKSWKNTETVDTKDKCFPHRQTCP